MMNSPPRRNPPRRTVSSPGTPVGSRSIIAWPLGSVRIVVGTRLQGQPHGEDGAFSVAAGFAIGSPGLERVVRVACVRRCRWS
jgi:hypothetical protein